MCFGCADRNPLPPARPVQHRSNPGQHQHHGTSQRTQNPPAAPPLPLTSPVPLRSGQIQVQNDAQSIPLQQLSRPGPSSAGDQQSGPVREEPLQEDVLEAIEAVAKGLNSTNIKWAIVGGAGLMALGSPRMTEDVDFVVYPPVELMAAENELRKDTRFSIDPRTRHTTFASSSGCAVEIEALSSPGTFKGHFDDTTPLITVLEGVHLLNAPLYLESKCGSLPRRGNNKKRDNDATDIRYILNFMIQSNIHTDSFEVPSATPDFIAGFEIMQPGATELFHQVGLA
jgi:hypothetical protein